MIKITRVGIVIKNKKNRVCLPALNFFIASVSEAPPLYDWQSI